MAGNSAYTRSFCQPSRILTGTFSQETVMKVVVVVVVVANAATDSLNSQAEKQKGCECGGYSRAGFAVPYNFFIQ